MADSLDSISAQPALSAHGIASVRGDRLLFRDLDVALGPHEVLQVHGPNGSGKSTLLRILCGLTPPTDGAVRWRGEDVARVREDFLAGLRYVGHGAGVKLDLTPAENLRFAGGLQGGAAGAGAAEALRRVELQGFEDMPARNLSAGQRRRIALARLLVRAASLWVLDEPFTSLDRDGTAMVETLLHEHLDTGGMAIVTSHQPLRLERARARELHLG